jgi:hypothetical protein
MRFLVLIIFLLPIFASAQHPKITATNFTQLKKTQQTLYPVALKIIQGINASDRFYADSLLTKELVRALKTPHSYYFNWDSLITISQLFAPDSSFKIFTWQLVINDNVVRQHGAIQINTPDGSLKLFPLIDKSESIVKPLDTITSNKAWFGALYYNLVQTKIGNQNVYTLLGFDEYALKSSRKIAEVLTFKNGEPVFGGKFFSFEADIPKGTVNARHIIEFKKNAAPKLNYDEELKLIMVEHLISETNEPKRRYTYVGDGDYEGFEWKGNKWLHIEKVFTQQLKDGEAPVPMPIDDSGAPTPQKAPKKKTPSKKGRG